MKIGFHLTPFWSPTDRGATRIIDEAVAVVSAASRMGFSWVSIGQHFVSHPTVWPQPFPILARLAPETGSMRLKTSVLLLPMLNAVEVAENIATLDHICHGRLDVGVAIGYREAELEAVGLARKDRVKKLEESLELMKRLWARRGGDLPRRLHLGRQRPHGLPALSGAPSAARDGRAERGRHPPRGPAHRRRLLRPPGGLARRRRARPGLPRRARRAGRRDPGLCRRVPLSLIVGASKEAARAAARELPRAHLHDVPDLADAGVDDGRAAAQPRRAPRRLDGERLARATASRPSPARATMGLERIGFTIYSLPREVEARIDYMQMIAERVLRPAGALA